MPKLPFDLNGFVKVDANRDHTVFQSSEGHIIHVSNKSIAKELHDALRKLPVQKLSQGGVVKKPLPGTDDERKKIQDSFNSATKYKKMADGGVVGRQGEDASDKELEDLRALIASPPPELVPTDANLPTNLPEGSVGRQVGMAISAGHGGQPFAPSPMPQAPASANLGTKAQLVAATPPAPEQQQMMGAAPAPEERPIQDMLGEYKGAIDEEARVAGKIGDAKVTALNEANKQLRTTAEATDSILAEKTQAYKDYAQYLANPENQVDPRRLTAGQGTWGKIATAIGLGIGGAPAMQFLQKQIDDDIKLQEKNIHNKSTLFAKNMELLGDRQAALAQTQVMMNQVAQNEISKATESYASEQAKNAGRKMYLELGLKNGELMQKDAQRAAQQRMLGAQTSTGNKYRDQIRAAEISDPKRADDLRSRLTPNGFADTADDAKEVKALVADSNVARSSIDRLQEIGKTSGSSISPTLRKEAQSLVTTLVASLNKPVTGGGPMTETERALVTDLAADPTRIFSLAVTNKAALDTLRKFVNKRETESLKARGLESNNNFTPRNK